MNDTNGNADLGGLELELVSRTLLDAAEIAAEHTLPRFRSASPSTTSCSRVSTR